MRHTPALATLLLILASLAGCASPAGHNSDSPARYQGVQDDPALSGPAEAEGGAVFCYTMIVCPLVTAVALPVETSTDSLPSSTDRLRSR